MGFQDAAGNPIRLERAQNGVVTILIDRPQKKNALDFAMWRTLAEMVDELAADAVQEAWLEILRGLGGLRDDYAFAAWAYRITTRRCARLIARRQSDRRLARAVEAEPREAGAEDTHDEGDGARVKRAMADLPPDQRAAMALFHLQGLSVAETAIALDVPAGTVKTRLMHARRKLRDSLEGGRNE